MTSQTNQLDDDRHDEEDLYVRSNQMYGSSKLVKLCLSLFIVFIVRTFFRLVNITRRA